MKELLFSAQGRLNRKPYALYSLALTILGLIPVVQLALILLIPSSIMIVIKRWHDLGKSGWLTLLLLIPIAGFFIALYLLFAKGTDADNEFGPNPIK
jgi:uncharacterized membrane protein YhaH (DUF805 family)